MPESDKHDLKGGLTPFSDRWGPVFVKELRQGLRARQFVYPFVAVQVIALIAISIEYLVANQLTEIGMSGFGGVFYFLLNIVFGIILPLTLFGALQPELHSGRNIELLLMSNLTRWQIVRGKWVVGSVLSGLMLVSLIPYALTRYYIGGVSLVVSFLMIVILALVNAVMNGIVIGASGFRNILVRLIVIGVCLVSCGITTSLCVVPISLNTASSSGGPLAFQVSISLLLGAVSSGLFIAYGLQLGRAQLKLYENPVDPPSSGLIIALIIFTPIIVGVTMATTLQIDSFEGIGSLFGTGGLLILALLIDRGPGKNSDIRYAQP